MNGSVQRTIPNVMLPFRSMITKSRSAAYYGSEYQLGHYVPTDIFRRELSAPAGVRHQRKPDWDGPHGLHPRNDRCRIPAASILDRAFKNPLPKWDRVFHMVLTIGSEAEWAGAYPLSLPERKQNINCRIMRQLIFPARRQQLRPAVGSPSPDIQVSEDEQNKNPLLKWDRTFSLSGSIRGGVEYLMRGNLASDISRYGVDPTGSSAMVMRRLAA